MDAGGDRYEYIPALNVESAHINMVVKLLEQHIQGWAVESKSKQRFALATKLGATC